MALHPYSIPRRCKPCRHALLRLSGYMGSHGLILMATHTPQTLHSQTTHAHIMHSSSWSLPHHTQSKTLTHHTRQHAFSRLLSGMPHALACSHPCTHSIVHSLTHILTYSFSHSPPFTSALFTKRPSSHVGLSGPLIFSPCLSMSMHPEAEEGFKELTKTEISRHDLKR